MVGFYVLNLAMVMSMVCCRSDGCYKMYMKMFTTFPVNLIFLTVFAAAFGCMVGIICMEYKVQSVVWIFGMCAVLIIALTIYAVKTKADVTGMGPYILVAVICFLMTGLILSLVDAAGGELGAGTRNIAVGSVRSSTPLICTRSLHSSCTWTSSTS